MLFCIISVCVLATIFHCLMSRLVLQCLPVSDYTESLSDQNIIWAFKTKHCYYQISVPDAVGSSFDNLKRHMTTFCNQILCHTVSVNMNVMVK